jgi:hypothetical protein
MSKQITFFMTHEDERNFLDAVHQIGPVKLIYNTFADATKMDVQSLKAVGATSNDANLSLVNPTITSSIKYKFYPAQSYHCVDSAELEAVQFNRCKQVNTWLANGRLWFDEKSNSGKKSAAFLKWASSLLKWIQENYHKDAAGHFIAPHALELSKAGKLRLGPPTEPSISLEERKRILGLEEQT